MESGPFRPEPTSIYETHVRLKQAEKSKARPNFERGIETVKSLPYDETTMQPWRQRALCQVFDPELFFNKFTESDAKQICSVCEVAIRCLEYALRTDQTEGVWGGMTPKERQAFKRARLRAR